MNFLISSPVESLGLSNNPFRRATALTPAREGNNTERTKLVASFNNADVCDVTSPAVLSIELKELRGLTQPDINRPRKPLFQLCDQVWKPGDGLRSDYQFHFTAQLEQTIRLCLGNTTHHSEDREATTALLR